MTTSPTETDLKLLVQSDTAPRTSAQGSHAISEVHTPRRVLTTLDLLPVGAKALISAVTGATALRRRLLEMGLGPGLVILLIRRAPLGDPLEIQVRDYQLSLRADQAKLISVIPV